MATNIIFAIVSETFEKVAMLVRNLYSEIILFYFAVVRIFFTEMGITKLINFVGRCPIQCS